MVQDNDVILLGRPVHRLEEVPRSRLRRRRQPHLLQREQRYGERYAWTHPRQ